MFNNRFSISRVRWLLMHAAIQATGFALGLCIDFKTMLLRFFSGSSVKLFKTCTSLMFCRNQASQAGTPVVQGSAGVAPAGSPPAEPKDSRLKDGSQCPSVARLPD